MGRNDVIIVDNMIDQLVQRENATSSERGDAFQRMAIEFVLGHTTPTTEDLDEGIVDGANDGGIDGFFISVNGSLVTDPSSTTWPRTGIELEVWICTCKYQDTFRQAPLDNLYSTLVELMDFSIAGVDLQGRYSESMLSRRTHWMYAYRKTAHRLSSFVVNIDYISRGDTQKLGESVIARARQIENATRSCFSNCAVRFRFFGATELVQLSRKPTSTPLRLKFREVLSQDNSYLMLADIREYFKFVVSDDGNLRRHLFDSNVRDFMGPNPVNSDIRHTLRDPNAPEFWWLNNGITILASDASIVGKEMSLEEIQIVNGLQTTEAIFRHFQSCPQSDSRGSVLIKVVQSNNDGIRDAIIRSTNNQTAVEAASLYATDKVQRDIEEVLKVHGLYYERRKNHYANQGYRQEEIVTPLYLGAGFVALGLKNLQRASSFGNGAIQKRSVYDRVFGHGANINVWLVIARVLKDVDGAIGRYARSDGMRLRVVRKWRYVVGFMAVARAMGKFTYSVGDLAGMDTSALTRALLDSTVETISTIKAQGKQEKRWTKEQIAKAGKAVEERYGVEGFDDWNPIGLGGGREWSPVDLDFAMMVDRHLPSQPWKPGTHKMVANELGCSAARCWEAIQFLVGQGIRNRQKDGVVYDPEGNVVDYDRERVKDADLVE